MKTAVSIPDKVYKDAEKLADRLGTSRSQLYARALSNYVALHNKESVTKKLNEIYNTEFSELDKGLSELQYSTLTKEEW
jgi:metal-responsive CopG/Arc/MetJ family transcriptional regulator